VNSILQATRRGLSWGLVSLACGCPAAAVLPTTPNFDPMSDDRPGSCVLERWEDGATAYVDCGSDTREMVRLVGIDAAELGFDDASRTRAQEQARLWQLPYATILRCGKAATARVKEICPEGSTVELHGDDSDAVDRRLAYVRCGGLNVNQRLVEEGHAGRHPYPAAPERPRLCR
jgi:endonuclease YncB( thermonuclease family)